ncbi:RecX family transcriptional regulator [Prevotella stercorea]|uniref:regulatory protein RecX n=1 Tax=Leyella stercorea TaxID=363265 RepID=UPI001C2CC4D3|nr:regulatory protein RecX [Leyella stercorea]MBU9898566.1 RecX family transcriptional regulator [Leyella stercorea]MBU9946389.1 RecX family transcriptional regulator [Leyella stercorea]
MLQKKKPITEQEALQKLSALCARAEHSSGEMLEKMRRWQLSEDARERVLDRLIDEKFVDDERFARLFVREKIRFDRWGRRKIEQALYQKGVASDISRRVLDEVDDEAYVAELKKLIAAKRRSVQAESDYEMRAKLTKYALGRGFDYNVIRQCIDGADELLDQ